MSVRRLKRYSDHFATFCATSLAFTSVITPSSSLGSLAAEPILNSKSSAAVPAAARSANAVQPPHELGPEEEYGEYLASPSELASVPVNEIVRSMRLNAQALRLGERIFGAYCAACHGTDMKGAPGHQAPDLTDTVWRFSGDDLPSTGHQKYPSDVEWTIRYGIRSGHRYARGVEVGMPAYDPKFRTPRDTKEFGTAAFLTPEEVGDMVEYVLELGGQPRDPVKAQRAAPIFQDNTKGNCFDCHGRRGTGIAAFGSSDLTRPGVYLYGATRGAILESISHGRHGEMPAFEKTLKAQELKAVSVFVFTRARK